MSVIWGGRGEGKKEPGLVISCENLTARTVWAEENRKKARINPKANRNVVWKKSTWTLLKRTGTDVPWFSCEREGKEWYPLRRGAKLDVKCTPPSNWFWQKALGAPKGKGVLLRVARKKVSKRAAGKRGCTFLCFFVKKKAVNGLWRRRNYDHNSRPCSKWKFGVTTQVYDKHKWSQKNETRTGDFGGLWRIKWSASGTKIGLKDLNIGGIDWWLGGWRQRWH